MNVTGYQQYFRLVTDWNLKIFISNLLILQTEINTNYHLHVLNILL